MSVWQDYPSAHGISKITNVSCVLIDSIGNQQETKSNFHAEMYIRAELLHNVWLINDLKPEFAVVAVHPIERDQHNPCGGKRN